MPAEIDRSDRLRKAIERNRAKRARQERGGLVRQSPPPSSASPPRRPFSQRIAPSAPPPPAPSAPAPSPAPNRQAGGRGQKFLDILLKGTWLFCGLLILRLVFTKGGVIDFYTKHNLLKSKQREYAAIEESNRQAASEIERIKHSAAYQRKLVRSTLGFIARDEFLVLFAQGRRGERKEREPQAAPL